MKKLLIAASICTIPFCFLGIINPIIYWMAVSKVVNNWFWFYVALFGLCLSIILTAMLMMTKYTKNIERLDDAIKDVEMQKQILAKQIRQYNTLIATDKL